MKQYTGLFEKICTMRNFKVAFKNAIKGKRHYKDVKEIFRIGPNKYLRELLAEVREKEYQVSPYHVFQLYTGHKWREIYKLPMRDRIVQHAIMNYLESIFRETFIVDTYSSIKTRGIHLGLQRVKKALKEGDYKYCLKLDVHKCYPSLDKAILKTKLARKFKDADLLWLLYTIIDSCEHGVPIGNYTSQYFNNFYFSDFDHWMKEVKRVKAYFRYCDDMVILSNSKEKLHRLLGEIQQKMAELHVHLKSNWQIFPIEDRGISFLGYVIRKSHVELRKNAKLNFIEKVSQMDFDNLSKTDINVLGSYWGILSFADCRHLWYIYTKVKTFQDLNIQTHKRCFVRDIIGIPIIVNNAKLILRGGKEWLRIDCSYTQKDKDGNDVEIDKVRIGTSGELLIEAAKQFNTNSYPFETVVKENDKGFYEFT